MSFRIKKPVTFVAAFLVASFVLFFTAAPLAQEGAAPPSLKVKEHEWLAQDVGKWKAECEWHGPGGAQTFSGTENVMADCGGLWVFASFEADFMGAPFKGRGVTGYDPATKKYVGAWVDSMTTRMMHLEGALEGDALVLHTEGIDPMTGKTYPEKHVTRREGTDKRVFEMFREDAGGHLLMKIVYTRTK